MDHFHTILLSVSERESQLGHPIGKALVIGYLSIACFLKNFLVSGYLSLAFQYNAVFPI